ncbi:hypothetical protein OG897_40615 [Streptomyces sp. NBC_00237]|uniref:hypothetical protein n=1 Tax=Streptomyces sp. NBC_00237 TaxID=2975687 RepID=UPI00225713BC|nr:hypothetical protein [Streptomyces sp. NBC_00237]MCX5207688.1 hypothetical protein [Streptomyces sp. NBC_00237]
MITLTRTGGDLDGTPLTGADTDARRHAALALLHTRAAAEGRTLTITAYDPDATWHMTMTPGGAVTTLPAPSPAPVTAPPADAAPDDWHAPLDGAHREAGQRLTAAARAGDHATAAALAQRLYQDLTTARGPAHPHAVQMLTCWSWHALHQAAADPVEATDLLIRTARLRHAAGAPPEDTQRAALNAYVVWRTLLLPADPETAREDASRLVDVLESLGHDDRARSVLELASQ